MNKEIEKILNEQINKELFSAYLYLSMSAYFESVMLKGAANWMQVQGREETEHAMKIYHYIETRSGRVVLEAIQGPKTEWKTPLSAFEEALEHEKYISGSINNIVSIAEKEKDYMTVNFLQWFIAEQVEEEANAQDNVDKLRLVEGNPNGVFMIDREMEQRVFQSHRISDQRLKEQL